MTKSVWRTLSQLFFKGCLVCLPLFLTGYFLVWVAKGIDGFFRKPFDAFLSVPEIPFGVGIVVGVLLILLVGLLTELAFVREIQTHMGKVIAKIPVVGTVFSSLNDIMQYLRPLRGANARGSAVIVTLEHSDFKIAGFLTRESLSDLPTDDDLAGRVAVYIPLAYMVGGGFTIFVKKEQVRALNLPFEKAMQLNLTAWMTHPEEQV